MEQEKSALYNEICLLVLDMFDAINKFLATATQEEKEKYPQFLFLAQRFLATIEKGKQLKK